MAAIDERSLYAAPFPHDESLDSLTAVFTAHAPVNSLRMRRHLNSKDFRGSVFVEFGSREDAERVRMVEPPQLQVAVCYRDDCTLKPLNSTWYSKMTSCPRGELIHLLSCNGFTSASALSK